MTSDRNRLTPALRDYLDQRFERLDLRLQELAHDVGELKVGQRETNGQVGRLQLWRAGVEGELRGLLAAAGGTRALVLTLVGVGSLGIGLTSLLVSLLR